LKIDGLDARSHGPDDDMRLFHDRRIDRLTISFGRDDRSANVDQNRNVVPMHLRQGSGISARGTRLKYNGICQFFPQSSPDIRRHSFAVHELREATSADTKT
jgi:hypothetical protein